MIVKLKHSVGDEVWIMLSNRRRAVKGLLERLSLMTVRDI